MSQYSQQRGVPACSDMLKDLPSYCSSNFSNYSPQNRLLSTRKVSVYVSTSPERNVIPIVNDRQGLLVHFLNAESQRQADSTKPKQTSSSSSDSAATAAAAPTAPAASAAAAPAEQAADGPTQPKVARLDESAAATAQQEAQQQQHPNADSAADMPSSSSGASSE
ncbi:hypothetical protein BOX15_Mlig027972g3 [Macrostomum lignano]|uniref:Uncharacterized protein n=2 Tax=Macrostomum lignano TaxID=282301 RepID=A0A267E3P7_9PLAT|nr:hypothetical protein BOX15_Mlig027972g3 [Macrostomum lignano]